jgi:hypothetical protein
MPDYGLKKLKLRDHRVFTSTGDITMVNEGVLVVNKASGAATAVTLPGSPDRGDCVLVKDGKGDAATNNITISAASGNIDGGSSFVIRTNYGSALFTYNGTQWNVGMTHDGEPANISMAASAGASNVSNVVCTVTDAAGNTIAGVHNFDLWLSDAASGAGLTGTTASGTVTVKSASGEVVGTYTTKKALRVQTLATGLFTLEITDSAKTLFKVCAQVPGSGQTVVGVTLLTASYGA